MVASHAMTPQYAPVFADIRDGLLGWEIWGRLGWRETRLRYQRTIIGPFWTTLSLGIFVGIMGILWSQLWKMDVKAYMPYLTSGMITWLLFSQMVVEGCGTFSGAENLIRQLRIPYTLLACSIVWRNLLVFFHNFVIYALVFVFAGVPLTWSTLLVIPGIVLLCLNGVWFSLVLGLICVRYRDIQQLIQSVLQIAMFLTPIFWSPQQLGAGRSALLVHYNPLFQYIEVVRAPLLGQSPDAWAWLYICVLTIAGWVLTLVLYSRFRRRLAYWL
jgi:homopolymeric O-antigen transport system permease protein